MAAGKTKSIDEIDDIGEMFEAMAALDIPSKGLHTLQDMKDRVKTAIIDQSSKSPSWNAGQAFSILTDAQEDDKTKKTILLSLYTEAEKLLDKLDPKIRALLQQSVGNLEEKMENHKLQLTRKEYFVLVAGETGSGKSSLINLILGEELLPYSVLSTTSTICELKFGKERKIVAHFKEKDRATKTIQLKESTEQNYLQQISPYVLVKTDRERGSIFKKIELFWPHSLLEKGIVIIDSPGIGESDIMDEIVKQYLPQAFAFIYVINSANAGGVQKDRLEKLLEEVRNISLERQGELPSKCALFVCNKWDQVPGKEVTEVKNDVVRKLLRCWPGVDPESQIIHMSTTKASKAQGHGYITNEFSNLMNGLRLMVLKSIEARLEIHWKWLDYLLSRIIYQARAFVMNASRDRDKVIRKMGQIVNRLEAIEKQKSEVVADLHQYLKTRTKVALQKLSEYLSSEEVKVRFTSWTLDEVPRSEDSWEVTKNEITKALSRRLREFIEQWEEDTKVFANARASLVQHFQTRYNFVEGQLRNLESAITADSISFKVQLSLETNFSLTEKVIFGVTSPIWVPLGLVALVIGVPIYGVMAVKSKLEERKKIKNYEEDKCAFMREASAVYLEDFKDKELLKPFVKEQMKEAKVCLKQIEARLPELIEADRMLCKHLLEERRSQKDIKDRYQPIMDEGTLIRGILAEFGLKEVRATDIAADNLNWKQEASSRLGRGAFGAVYQGEMKRDQDSYIVALKLYNDVLDATNASLFMAEVQILRKLNHPHIVKFYGTSLLPNQGSVRIILVLEWCKGNLQDHIFKNRQSIPGKSKRADAIQTVRQWVKEITDALAYIHGQGIVHRDLKLENVLLSQENSVKVTDVGISKAAVDITGTIAGSPAYIAPEVFHSEVYDSKADIYSLGIMLWEIWYGDRAFAKTESVSLEAFFSMVDSGCRPEHLEDHLDPPPCWQELMKECWKAMPEKRPSAKQCHERVLDFF